jgi:hypothetical protein
MAPLVRFLIILLFLSSAVSLSARGRSRGYQAGGGMHRAQQAKVPVKKSREKPKKPSLPPQQETAHSSN